MKDYIRFTGVLFLISCIAALSLAGVYKATKPNIDKQTELEKAEALKTIFGDFDTGNEPFEFILENGRKVKEIKDKNGNLLGYAFEVVGKGFSSNIRITVGMKDDGTIIGIKVTYQEETPGLGARMNEVKSNKYLWTFWKKDLEEGPSLPTFQNDFKGKRFINLTLTKSGDINDTTPEIEAITGATITSKAVLDAVQKGCEELMIYLEKNPNPGER
ncbi:MAG TPA: RnfABCDGE type electron transport complex subunit G [Firmicutes bacterium]|nr:RnfABCDGE type electron transport complex subunit G [Bacillota bacterium]